MPSRALWTNTRQGRAGAWYARESRTCPASTAPRRDTMTSSTAISHDASQQAVHQPASATDTLVERHLGLVVHLAKRYAGSYQGHHLLDLDDLVQGGVLGLMHAAEKFDARKGFRFSTYATHWIRWAIGQAIMNESRTIHLPIPIRPPSTRLLLPQSLPCQHQP